MNLEVMVYNADLFTADDKLILMTSTFDVVTETTLHPGDFGEGVML